MPSAFARRFIALFPNNLLPGTLLSAFNTAALLFASVSGIITAQMLLRLPPH